MRPYLRLLQNNPDFTRVWLAQAVSLLGDWFNAIVLAAIVSRYAAELTGDNSRSGLAISAILLARFLPPLLVSPLAGVLLDRFDRKRLLIASDILRVVIVLGFLLASTPDRLWLIYVLTIAQFTVGAIFEPGRSALLPSITRPQDLVTANLLGSMTWSVMLAIGGMLGGLVAGVLGTAGALIIDAATFAISALLLLPIRPRPLESKPDHPHAEAPKASARDFVDGLRYVRAHPSIGATLLVKLGGNFGSIDAVMIIFATAIFVLGEDGVLSLGILWGSFGIGAVLGPLVLNRFNDGSVHIMRRLIIIGFAAITIGWFVLSGSPTLLIAAVGIIIKAVGSSIYWTYSSVILQKTADERFLGRMFSLDYAGFQLAVVISTLITGLALEALGNDQVRTVVFVTGFVSLLPLIAWVLIVIMIERAEQRAQKQQLALHEIHD